MWRFFSSFLAYVFILSLTVWVIGFGAFCLYTLSLKYVARNSADAIVVLTGGENRIETGIKLLQQESAQLLFISGVHQKVSLDDILPESDRMLKEKITLGYKAQNTVGNARETADWIQDKKIHSVLLVTSFYHMPRSITEVLEKAPELKIRPYPVFPKTFESSVDWVRTRYAWLLFVEYHKFIVAYLKNKLERIFFNES